MVQPYSEIVPSSGHEPRMQHQHTSVPEPSAGGDRQVRTSRYKMHKHWARNARHDYG